MKPLEQTAGDGDHSGQRQRRVSLRESERHHSAVTGADGEDSAAVDAQRPLQPRQQLPDKFKVVSAGAAVAATCLPGAAIPPARRSSRILTRPVVERVCAVEPLVPRRILLTCLTKGPWRLTAPSPAPRLPSRRRPVVTSCLRVDVAGSAGPADESQGGAGRGCDSLRACEARSRSMRSGSPLRICDDELLVLCQLTQP